jgi:hypothetical protein
VHHSHVETLFAGNGVADRTLDPKSVVICLGDLFENGINNTHDAFFSFSAGSVTFVRNIPDGVLS